MRELGLEDVTWKWKKEGGRGKRPGITTAEVIGGRKAKQKSLFEPPKRKPTAQQRKTMVALALEIGIKMVMKNHLYRFNNNVYLQREGGPIGLELTGAIARVYMLWWDGQLLAKMKELMLKAKQEWNIYLYMRYVDDANFVTEGIQPGIRYKGGKM